MSSRLYPATKWLFSQVFKQLCCLGLRAALTPLNFALMALYITGIILLEKRQTATRIARWLPGREHDALNRLLRCCPVSTTQLFAAVIQWASRMGEGYLCIDDVVVSKPHSKVNRWVGWTYSTAEKRKVRGFHIVVVLWCNGVLRIPVAFRIWRPKAGCRAHRYRKKTELAEVMLRDIAQTDLSISYVVGDTLYSGNRMCKLTKRLGWEWIGVLHPNTTLIYRGKRYAAATFCTVLRPKWRAALRLRAVSCTAYAPSYGHLRLVMTRNRHGNCELLATSKLSSDLTTIVRRKRSRWSIETLFRDTKQDAALASCQCRVDQALVRHVAFVFITFVVLQLLGLRRQETVGETVERLRLSVMTQHAAPPPVLQGRTSIAELLTA